MSNQTKILVIHMKELIIGLIVAIALIILTIFVIVSLGGKSDSTNNSSTGNSSSNTGNPSGKSSSNTYMPGVYTSSISVNGTPLEIQVTVDENNINAIELNNLSDSITTMYPMMQNSFHEIVTQVIANGGTENVTYAAENKYTSTLLLQGIAQVLQKCTAE